MRYTLEYLDTMEGHDFEFAVADLLRHNGYRDVKVTQGSGDFGIDILARRKNVKYAIQCKRYKNAVGVKVVQEAGLGTDFYHCDAAAVITNSTFTKQAQTLAQTTGVRLWDRSFLEELIDNYDDEYDEFNPLTSQDIIPETSIKTQSGVSTAAKHPDKYFSFVKTVGVEGVLYDVDVDILAGMYGGTQPKKRSQHVQGIRALKATAGNLAFDFPPQKIHMEAKRPDGALDTAKVSVVAVVPYFIMKTAAMGRGKAKDAYDIYFLLKHYRGGVRELAKEFQPVENKKLVQEMKEKLAGKFSSPEYAGPKDVADFLGFDDDEDSTLIKRDSYEQIQASLDLI